MIGPKEFALMKKSSFLVNVARAAIVDREALFKALYSNKISGAAFDVFWEEPPDPNDKLLKLQNFILTPHVAGWTIQSVDTIARIITTNLERWLAISQQYPEKNEKRMSDLRLIGQVWGPDSV
jgi:D-3-phosphoglycerate dehydrogenase